MSTANHDISLSAYRALMALHHETCFTEVMYCSQFSSKKILISLFKLGVNREVAKLLEAEGDGMVSSISVCPGLKLEKMFPFFSMLEALGRYVLHL